MQLSDDDIDALNKRCYDACADNWARLPFANFLPQAILRAHLPNSGWNAIDIGSGTGSLALWLSQNGYQVLCLDPSDEMVRRTRALGLTTLPTTLQHFCPTEKYDLALAILSLIHVPKNEMSAQIDKIASMLNPGGVFALSMIEGKGEGVGEKTSAYPRYFAYYTRQEILDLVSGRFVLVEEQRSPGSIAYLTFIFRKKGGAAQ